MDVSRGPMQEMNLTIAWTGQAFKTSKNAHKDA